MEPIYCGICGTQANSKECTTTGVVYKLHGLDVCDVCCGGLPTAHEAAEAVRANGMIPIGVDGREIP